MGEGRARRPGGLPLSLGQRGSGRVAGIHSSVEWGSEGAFARRTWVAESVRTLRHRRERPRVVRRLVLKSLLYRLAPAQSPGASDGRAARIPGRLVADRKSTRLNSSHGYISYAVFCLKKKK